MLRIPYSEVLNPDYDLVAQSFEMRSNQFPSHTERGPQQRETLDMPSKKEIQNVGKAIIDGGTCSWHDLLGKPETM